MDAEKENEGVFSKLGVPFSLNQIHIIMIHAEMKSGKQRLHKMNSVI